MTRKQRLTVLVAIGAAGCAASTPAPAQLTPREADLANGETLFNIGGCASCHTAEGGEALAGGLALDTPFGVFKVPNITPDEVHGLGGWSEAEFVRAMREGVSPKGAPYYPAFPYTSYSKMSEDDVRDLWAYLQTFEPAGTPNQPHELSFPYNIRTGLWAWRVAFFDAEEFEPDPAQDEAWNRGAYLVLGPGHCAECHSPRNFAGALVEDSLFGGTPDGPDGEPVPDISQSEDGLADWSQSDLKTALSLGMLPDGDFLGGEMGEVVENSTSKLQSDDLDAIVAYILSLPPR